ncbi:MAG: efflux RND transporter permease subunit [Bacteroidales bacterium]|nr:efflux RND transporter permease subunit [Bacteroidales bacterium]
MWFFISKTLLRYRTIILLIVVFIVVIMFYFARNVKLSYELPQLLPDNDTTYKEYLFFRELFGEDGSVVVIASVDSNFFNYDHFRSFIELNNNLKSIEGVEEVASPVRIVMLHKDTLKKKFEIKKIVDTIPMSQREVDSLKNIILSNKFYKGLLFIPEKHIYLALITLNKKFVNDENRFLIINQIEKCLRDYSEFTNIETHISGLPYIRSKTTELIKHESYLFIILSVILSLVIMFIYFRSFRAIFSSLIVVAASVITFFGLLVLFDFKLTILTALVPSLLIIIGIENCIYFINRYTIEFKEHNNNAKALTRILQRIGTAVFLTNITTAIGFGSFALSSNSLFREFGIISSLNIIIEFIYSIILIPILLSLFRRPKSRHLKYISGFVSNTLLLRIEKIIIDKSIYVFVFIVIVLIISIIGIFRIKISGKLVDDLKKNNVVYTDLKFFEQHIGGIMPFEIIVNTGRKKGVLNLKNLKRMEELQLYINENFNNMFSKPVSIVEVLKYANQCFYNNDTEKYKMPTQQEFVFINDYMPDLSTYKKKTNFIKSFIDSTQKITRISYQIKDIGYNDLKILNNKLKQKIDSIFPEKKYKVYYTGNSVIFAKGTSFLLKNLFQSVLIAIVLISMILGILFTSYRMIIISIIPNIAPLVIVGGIMGFAGIPLKPSTIIIFSIAIGIAVDNAIHFLTRYKFELKNNQNSSKEAVIKAIHNVGHGMIFASSILIIGFSLFSFSQYGGTSVMGILISITLLLSLLINLIVLPSLLYKYSNYLNNSFLTQVNNEIK